MYSRKDKIEKADWGEIPYLEAQQRQLQWVEEVACGERLDTVVFCTHPPVVTKGRGTQEGEIFAWRGEIVETSRGGRATYHGPDQIVIYPLIDLDRRAQRDLHRYLRSLEQSVVAALAEFGVSAEARQVRAKADGPSLTGVWWQDKKVASIGVAVKKWITYHGVALNVDRSPTAFQGIQPCGFSPQTMTSLEAILGHKIDRENLQQILFTELSLRLQG